MIPDDYLDVAGKGITKVNNVLGGGVYFLAIGFEKAFILTVTVLVIFVLFPFWCLEKICMLLK